MNNISKSPVLLLIFYKDWLLPRRKEWSPLSAAASEVGFQTVVAEWEKLSVEDEIIRAGEAFVCQPESSVFETAIDFTFKPAIVMTTWGTSGYHELFKRIVSLGAYNSEYYLIANLDGKCELERCLRDYEQSTGHSVSRPPTYLWDELIHDSINTNNEDFVILKPSHSGQCKGIEIVPSNSLKALAQETIQGKRPKFVVQKLVGDVFLYNSRRWDIRINVLVTSLSPLSYHLYPQGVAKTTGVAVNPGSVALEQWLNAESFLGNQHTAENLPLSDMLEYIERDYLPMDDFWPKVDEVVRHVFSAIAMQAEKENLPLEKSFMYAGLDFIVERSGKAGYELRLLEINSHPGLGWEPEIMAALAPQFRSWFTELKKMALSPN